ncbi:MAG TPA: outer membrane beta-barrel protein [Terriglobales bacterium]|jgi:opacity protein-like surface antigen
MIAKTATLSTVLSFVLLASASAQNVELTGQVGGQLNGGLDLSTSIFHRIEVGNSINYGVTLGYLVGDYYGLEFQWNHAGGDALAQPIGVGSSINVFSLSQNQYMGNIVFHFKDREAKVRPFAFLGLGATNLSPDRSGLNSATRFAVSLGGGAKYNLSQHIALRGQLKWSPTYITTTDGGYWCDPFWGGCWVVGNDHYLHEFDMSGGITLRF